MNPLIIGIIGLVVGIFGIGFGSIIGMLIKKTDKILSFFLGLSGGFMMFIVSFHLLPEAFYLGGTATVLLGVTGGILVIIILEKILEGISSFTYIRSGVILALGIAVHGLPEGLALGSTLMGISDFGFVLTIAMLLHNIPEGIAMTIPLSMNKVKPWKILLISTLVGLPIGIGAYAGAYFGSTSNMLISLCLAVAGGTMLYIVADEIIPTGKTLHKGRVSSIALVIGFMMGIIIYF